MISEDEAFVHIHSLAHVLEYLRHEGKWLIYSDEKSIRELGEKMKPLVGKNGISAAKFSKMPATEVPERYAPGKSYILVVYCSDKERNGVRSILKDKLGVSEMFWKYERLTWKERLKKGDSVPVNIIDALKLLEEI